MVDAQTAAPQGPLNGYLFTSQKPLPVYYRTINYLKATGLALGYVINFGNPDKLQWKRVVMSDNLIEDEL